MSAVRRRGGECRQLTYDGIVDGYNFGFKLTDERIAHVLIIVMARLRVARRIVHMENVLDSLPTIARVSTVSQPLLHEITS